VSEIAVLAASNAVLVLNAPLFLLHRGRVFEVVETPRHGLTLQSVVSVGFENGLTTLTAQVDTPRQSRV
jgi:hypothetical protein